MTKLVTKQQQDAAIEALKRVVNQESSYDEATVSETTPFGQGIDNALTEMLKVCEEIGFKTFKDPNGNYGYAEVGSGEQIFGIIGHVDTVPAGDVSDWKANPFDAQIIDDAIYGRGTQDDKGPSIAALFAVKALMDQGYEFNCRIRFIFGTDEETLWRGIKVYTEKEEPITMGIAPDAEFPLIYAEKGLEQAYLVGPGSDELNLNLANAFNAVPAKAHYNGPKLAEVKASLDDHHFDYEDHGDDGITVIGKSVHAMNAPEGTNAVLRLAIALSEAFPDNQQLALIGKVFKEDATGTNLIGDVADDQSGHLTINLSSLEITKDETKIQLDMRIPVTFGRDEVVDKVKAAIEPYGYQYVDFDYLDSLYVPTDSELVTTLMDVYKEITGDQDAHPEISGGATYARTMNQCVAFGAMLPDVPDFMHQVNENWPLKSMFKAMDIYAEAIKRLCVK